jgi:two-component system chemotaxis sensor kinase CheA
MQPSAAEADNQTALKSSAVADSTIRVDVGLLDKLMNLVGELVLARSQILQLNAQQEDTTLNVTSQRLNLITTELQEGVMKTRMQPIAVVWNKLPRLVRDLAATRPDSVDVVQGDPLELGEQPDAPLLRICPEVCEIRLCVQPQVLKVIAPEFCSGGPP